MKSRGIFPSLLINLTNKAWEEGFDEAYKGVRKKVIVSGFNLKSNIYTYRDLFIMCMSIYVH